MMNAHTLRKLLRRENLIPLVALLLFSSFVVFGVAPGDAQSPEKEEKEERKIETRIPAHLPIKVKFKNEEKVKDFKNDDWEGDLEVEVTNTGTKPIYSLDIELLLPDVVMDDPATTTAGYTLRYGRPQLVDLTTPLESSDVRRRHRVHITRRPPDTKGQGAEFRRPKPRRRGGGAAADDLPCSQPSAVT